MKIEFTREIVPGRKLRVHQWIDTGSMAPMYGVQSNVAYGKWAHVVVGDKPVLFATKAEADAQIKRWRAP